MLHSGLPRGRSKGSDRSDKGSDRGGIKIFQVDRTMNPGGIGGYVLVNSQAILHKNTESHKIVTIIVPSLPYHIHNVLI